jgi:hypothetical protein
MTRKGHQGQYSEHEITIMLCPPNFQIEQIVLLISLSIVLTLYIILELPVFDCIIIINSIVAVALYEERIYIGLSCYPILFSTFLNKIRLNQIKS